MKFRKSTKSDITNILEIIFEAQNYVLKNTISTNGKMVIQILKL